MKTIYLDIMEKSLSAYTEERIREYIDEVKSDGLTEHGFPRLGANIGILMAHGRRLELKSLFIQIINLCLYGFAHPVNTSKGGNNFAVREVCHALMELAKTDVIDREQLEIWKEKLASLDVSATYTHIVSEENPHPHNWAYFAVVSEQARGHLCGIESAEFVEHQLPSQLARLDENGMYRDPNQPVVYDFVARLQFMAALSFGYDGPAREQIEEQLLKSALPTLQMQSVTGEIPYGGRSNGFLHNESFTSE